MGLFLFSGFYGDHEISENAGLFKRPDCLIKPVPRSDVGVLFTGNGAKYAENPALKAQ